MKHALSDTLWLYKNLLNHNQRFAVDEFMSDMYQDMQKEALTRLWRVDEEIGGIGGYCLPKNPVQNPFPGGERRSLFRPLQYAACELERDVSYGSRYIVQYAGMHLEAVTRRYLKQVQPLGSIRHYNSTLGKSVHKIASLKTVDQQTVQSLMAFVRLYNMSKHEVNQDESKDRLFSVEDALITYLTARILGVRLLTGNGSPSVK
ncbi:hypothetical protein [Exiguobacterium sp. KJ 601]|uniref:hypothetical protein n=1 Tax=Exiguobacterium sp. KJ 601 TaxID=2782569 RepID=UPI0022AE577F|nr:hypothetical protein [Exiguobacterium sp. KJ 601]